MLDVFDSWEANWPRLMVAAQGSRRIPSSGVASRHTPRSRAGKSSPDDLSVPITVNM